MSEPNQPQVNQAPGIPPSRSRRRFLGTGAAVSPAILTLVSQPALGVTCFTPSRSLSRNTSVSQQGKYGECLNPESPGNYMARASGQPGNSWTVTPSTTPFHPTFSGSTFMVPKSGGGTRSMTMQEVLLDQNGKVPFFILAAYLNVLGNNGAVIPANVLTPSEVLTIWTEWNTKTYYEPMAGIKWYGEDIKNYFFSNGIIK